MKSVLILLLTFGLVGVAEADPYKGIAFAGGSYSGNAAAYAGTLLALPGDSLGKGFALKLAASGGSYEYDGGPGQVDVTYYGGVVGLAHQWSGAWGWATFSAGASMTQTDLTPFDPGNDRAGFRTDAVLATDGAVYIDPQWRVDWYGESGVRNESYLARVTMLRSVKKERWMVGAEGIIQGDPAYQKKSVGAVLAYNVSNRVVIRVSTGAVFQDARNMRPYGTIGISRMF